MDEEIRPILQHGRVSAHPAAGFVDPPTAASGIARPHEGYAAPVARRGAKVPDLRFAHDWERKILEPDAVEYVLSGRKPLDHRLGREIRLRQSLGKSGAANVPETVAGRNLHQHARRPIRTRPDDAGIGGNVARLDTVGDQRAISRAAEIGSEDSVDGADRCSRSRSRQESAPR